MRRPLVFALVLALSATGAWADRYSDCSRSRYLDLTIRGCTQVIERGKWESQKDRAVAYHNRGLAYYRKGELDRAIADYAEAIALNPKYVKAYTGRGNAYKNKGEYDRAIIDYTKAIALDPNYVPAYGNRGLAYQKKGDKEQAIADYRKALEINPSDEKAKGALKVLGVTPATAEEQSVEDKAVAPPEERAAPKKSVRVRVCEKYETDATGQRGKCLKYKSARTRKALRGGFGPAGPRPRPPGHGPRRRRR
jgi:tetratricopeptide (TPR) repeat protein